MCNISHFLCIFLAILVHFSSHFCSYSCPPHSRKPLSKENANNFYYLRLLSFETVFFLHFVFSKNFQSQPMERPRRSVDSWWDKYLDCEIVIIIFFSVFFFVLFFLHLKECEMKLKKITIQLIHSRLLLLSSGTVTMMQ